MPVPSQNAVHTTLTAVVIFLALCLFYTKLQIENVLIPRIKKRYRKWRYC